MSGASAHQCQKPGPSERYLSLPQYERLSDVNVCPVQAYRLQSIVFLYQQPTHACSSICGLRHGCMTALSLQRTNQHVYAKQLLTVPAHASSHDVHQVCFIFL